MHSHLSQDSVMSQINLLIANGDKSLVSGDQPNARTNYEKAISLITEYVPSSGLLLANTLAKMGDSRRDSG